MARYAYQKVPLYYRIAERESLQIESLEFDEFPTVSKADYVESGMSCLSSEYIGDYIGGRLKMTRTSGSTGKFTEVYWNKEEDIRSLFSLWMYRRKYYGITTMDKLCYFFLLMQEMKIILFMKKKRKKELKKKRSSKY